MVIDGALALDSDQLAAARTDPRTPLLVLAGPGSGKTSCLAERIAHLRACQRRGGLPPGAIVALTFTRNAARELEARWRARGGDDLQGQVEVRTFHSYGLRLLRDGWAEAYLGWSRFRVATTGQAHRATTAAIAGVGLDVAPAMALEAIGDAKLGRRIWRLRRADAQALRVAYDAWLRDRQLIDVHDMLVLPVEILRTHPRARADLRRRTAHIVSDEGQDWNRYQAALIAHAGGPQGHITAVGDHKQCIYGGSSPRYLVEFPLAFPHTRVVSLTRTYRLHAAVLAVANAVAAHIAGTTATGVPMLATGPQPALHIARSAVREREWIAHELHALRASGLLGRWANAAVLLRTHQQCLSLLQALTAAGIPCHTHAHTPANTGATGEIIAWLALLHDGGDGAALLQAVDMLPSRHYHEAPATLRTTLDASGPWTMDRLHREVPPGLADDQKRVLGAFVRLYDGLADLAARSEPVVVFDALLERTGLQTRLVQADPGARTQIAALRELVAEEGDVGALQQALAEETLPEDRDAVLVSTVHAFKGNQAEVVFLAGLDEGVFPHRLCLREGPEGLQQELRAFYVALTRPRTLLYLSASCEPASARAEVRPSRFLELIPRDLLRSA